MSLRGDDATLEGGRRGWVKMVESDLLLSHERAVKALQRRVRDLNRFAVSRFRGDAGRGVRASCAEQLALR
jgi:hypothetical protein